MTFPGNERNFVNWPQNGTVNPADLTDTERLLWEAFPRGEWVDLSRQPAGEDPVVRAEVIAALLLGAVPAEPGYAARIRVRGATVTGPLELRGGTAAQALVCQRCRFDSELSLVDGSFRSISLLDCELPGLDCAQVRLKGTLDLSGSRLDGRLRLENAKINGQLRLRGTRITGAGPEAIAANGLVVAGDVDCPGLEANGEVSFRAAAIAGSCDLSNGRITAPGERALVFSYATIGGKLEGRQLVVNGETRANNCRIAAHVSMWTARLENPGGVAFWAGGLTVGGGAFFSFGFRAVGEFRLIGAQLAANLTITGASFDNAGGVAVNLDSAVVRMITGDELTCRGRWTMVGARIGGDVTLARAVLESAGDGHALNAERTQIDGALILSGAKADGGVDLRHAVVGVLHDDPAAWPDRLYLDGLTYQALYPRVPADQRLGWLARDPDGHQPQPYEQLAAYYTAVGEPGQARDVLYARERIQRPGKGRVSRTWSLLQDITVGYGYRPRRALGWLALLLTIGSIVFSVAPPPAFASGAAPHFNGIVYTLDLMLPVVNLGQKYAFNPSGAEQWLSYLLIAAGWTLATTVAAGLARVLRRN